MYSTNKIRLKINPNLKTNIKHIKFNIWYYSKNLETSIDYTK